jgi:hypothetical protein
MLEHLQPILPFVIPEPPPTQLVNAFLQVDVTWAVTVNTLLPPDLQHWIDWYDEDRVQSYSRPEDPVKRGAWKAEYRRAQGIVLNSLPPAFIHQLGKISNLELGFGAPIDLYLFIREVNRLCASLDVSPYYHRKRTS